jgi:hypothetical protein
MCLTIISMIVAFYRSKVLVCLVLYSAVNSALISIDTYHTLTDTKRLLIVFLEKEFYDEFVLKDNLFTNCIEQIYSSNLCRQLFDHVHDAFHLSARFSVCEQN